MANGNDRGSTLRMVLIVLKAAVRMRALRAAVCVRATDRLRIKLAEARVDSFVYSANAVLLQTRPLLVFSQLGVKAGFVERLVCQS